MNYIRWKMGVFYTNEFKFLTIVVFKMVRKPTSFISKVIKEKYFFNALI